MTNISEDRRVVLTALREVPYETTFLLSEAKQDQSIKNRYWFDLPNQWTHQANKDPIIGIRSIYRTNTNRFMRFNYKIELIPASEESTPSGTGLIPYEGDTSIDIIEGTINCWLDGSETIKKIADTFNEWWLKDGTRTNTYSDEEHKWDDWEIQAYYAYDREKHTTRLCFGRGILENPEYLIDRDNESLRCYYWITITPISNDAQVLFNTTSSILSFSRVEIPIWSRYNCLVKSSIASNDKNNILGHTRDDPYIPLKYYRLNHDVNKFWIELYETRFHDSPVVFPNDNRDDLMIEAIMCLTSQAML